MELITNDSRSWDLESDPERVPWEERPFRRDPVDSRRQPVQWIPSPFVADLLLPGWSLADSLTLLRQSLDRRFVRAGQTTGTRPPTLVPVLFAWVFHTLYRPV